MGNDAPLACLSSFQPLLYDYFKQLFAQVNRFHTKFVFLTVLVNMFYPVLNHFKETVVINTCSLVS